MTIKVKENGVTFSVHDVQPTDTELPVCRTSHSVNSLLEIADDSHDTEKIIYCSDYNSFSVGQLSYHSLIAATHLAFSQHKPLVLSPDIIWISILQGFAQHVNCNAEELRDKFVSHKGKQTIKVGVGGVFSQSPESAWDKVIEALSDALSDRLGSKHDNLVSDFTTTGITARLASQVTLLDAFQAYFEYRVYCICGIPEITIEGELSDWVRLREKVDFLDDYDLDWWLPDVKNIADHFVRAYKGDVDLDHWQNIYKRADAYGGDQMNGWILKLIPYLKDFGSGSFSRRNPLLEDDTWVEPEEAQGYGVFRSLGNSVTARELPSGLSMAPFILVEDKDGREVEISMQLLGGFTGVENDNGRVKPRVGYAVRNAPLLDRLLDKIPEKCEVEPGLFPGDFDNINHGFIEGGNSFGGRTIAGDLLKFYRRYNGMRLNDLVVCSFNNLEFVQFEGDRTYEKNLTSSAESPPSNSAIEITFTSEEAVKFASYSDGSYLVVDMSMETKVWHIKPGECSLAGGSFSEFLCKIIQE